MEMYEKTPLTKYPVFSLPLKNLHVCAIISLNQSQQGDLKWKTKVKAFSHQRRQNGYL